MTSSKPSPRPIDVTLVADVSRFNKTMRRAAGHLQAAYDLGTKTFRRLAKRRSRHVPRRSGVGARQVLIPGTRKAARHPWALDRGPDGRLIPFDGPLPHREV